MELSLTQIWLLVGLLMLVAELISVSLVFVFFAIGAFVTAILASLGILPGLNSQLLIFSLASVVSLISLRKQAKHLFKRTGKLGEYQEFVGETAMVIREIPGSGEGRIVYRGAEWIALSRQGKTIVAGSKVVIKETDGIRLLVEEA